MADTRDPDLLDRLERYYDEAPRANADAEEHGPFTVFVSRGGWPYYARPRLGLSDEITPDQVSAVLDLLGERGLPRSIEWVHETTPSLRAAAVAAGVEVAVGHREGVARRGPPLHAGGAEREGQLERQHENQCAPRTRTREDAADGRHP